MAQDQTKIGHVIEVIGPVVDVQFEEGHLPFDSQRGADHERGIRRSRAARYRR